MKIYVAYKYTGADKEKLKILLTSISKTLEKQNHSTFMYFRDGGKWESRDGYIPVGKVMRECFVKIKESDCILILAQSSELSEGMLLDIGYAIALNKPIIVLKQENCSLPKTEALATKILTYKNEEDIAYMLVV